MVEMAMLLPVFAVLVFAMLEATRMCMVAQILTNAARDGCRVAATPGKFTSDVTHRINATLTSASITPSLVTTTIIPTSIETTRLNDPITVTVSVPFSSVNWVSPPFFYKTTTLSAKAVMLSQRP
jgi:Flp pilus assembly protein TadG